VTLVNRLKAAPPHFVPHVKAPAPKIIMRRSSDLGKDRDPAPGIILRMIKSSPIGGQIFFAALAELPNPPSSARRALSHAFFDPCSCQEGA
jgi:hypothetical protein